LTKCHELKNAFLEMKAANETLTDNDEGLKFLQNAEKLVDLMYQYSLTALNQTVALRLPPEIKDLSDEMNKFIEHHKDPKQFEKFKQANADAQKTFEIKPPQPSKTESKQAKKSPKEDLMSRHRKSKRDDVPETITPIEPAGPPRTKRNRY
jgi:hypothetical protein